MGKGWRKELERGRRKLWGLLNMFSVLIAVVASWE